jgi:S-adenosylmethionine hydrolase
VKIITFLTDFGLKDGYVAQMKAVALNISNAKLVDITHEINPHNVFQGAYILRTCVPFFPQGSVHVAIIDPGVGTNRRGIVISAGKHILVGPDNGLLLPVSHYFGDFIVYKIENEKFMKSSISQTFHGRDIFSPIAAHISNGISIEEIGSRITDFVDLDFGVYERKGNIIVGKIIHIDRFGNIITNISGDIILSNFNYNNEILIYVLDKTIKVPFVSSYGFIAKGKLLATIGSGNLFEIAINQGQAARKLSVKEQNKIEIILN